MSELISNLINSIELQISTIILIFGALCYYFGRIISYPRIFKVERSDVYIQGVLYVLSFLLLPGIPVILFYKYAGLVNPIIFSILFFISFIFLIKIFLTARDLHKRKISFPEFLINEGETKPYYVRQIPLQLMAFWIVITTVLFSFSSFQFPGFSDISRLIMITVAILGAFTLLTIFAMFYGYTLMKYPLVKIEYEIGNESNNLRIIKGRIINRSDFFIVLTDHGDEYIKNDRVIHIENLDKIKNTNSEESVNESN